MESLGDVALETLNLQLSGAVGTFGSGDSQFDWPHGVSVDHTLNRVRVADARNKRIVVMTLWRRFVRILVGKLEAPHGVAAALGSGILYITDYKKHCVVVMNEEDGTVLRLIGEEGFKPGQLYMPWGIALSEDRLYVTERGAHRVQVFQTDGTPVTCYGNGCGSGWGQFCHPKGIAISGGTLLVVDCVNHRIQRLAKSSGRFLESFCSRGSGEGQLRCPCDIAAVEGRIYITDYGNARVVVLSQGGQHLGAFGSEGDGDGQFRYLRGVGASGPVLAVCSAGDEDERTGDHQRVTVYTDLQLARGGEALRRHLRAETSWMKGQEGMLADFIAECVGLEDVRQWGGGVRTLP